MTPEQQEIFKFKNSSCILMILTFLIVVSVIFEKIKDGIEEAAAKNVRPILEALFSEMTVLGFLGVVSFFITKSGAMQLVGDFVYGEGTEEAEETGELFENVHMMLFLVMVLFIFQVRVECVCAYVYVEVGHLCTLREKIGVG
jgi:hypothetical protein